MTSGCLIPLGEFIATRTGSVDPTKFPDEVFDLYSIPAFDQQRPEIAIGRSIGSAKQVVRPGDVLLSKIVPHIRRSWVVGAQNGRRIIASGEWIVFRSDHVDGTYLRHLLVSNWFHAQFMNTVSGVGGSLLRARAEYVAKIAVPVPPIAEQRRIADILDRADALRAKRCAALGHFASLEQSTFVDMFGDPITNSKEWPLHKFGRVGTLDRGVSKHRPRNAPELLGGSYPFVQTGDIANCDGYIRHHASTYSDIGLKQSKLWPAGTLCITIAANIAKTGILTFAACFPDSVVGFRAYEPATVEFVRAWLSFLQKLLEDSAPQSAQRNINLAILRDLDVPLPPTSMQREFAVRVAAIEKLKAAHQASLSAFLALRASLQNRAFDWPV